jgi:kynurenine formamidase
MSRRARLVSVTVLLLIVAVAIAGRAQNREIASRDVTQAEYDRWKRELSNWGRWGKDDQLGTLNLLTPARRRAAAALVREGISISLAADADTVKAVDNPTPYEHEMLGIGSDRIGVNYHGIAHTHIDSLAHINDNGVFYNGYAPDAASVLKTGHARNSIYNLKNGIVARAVLIDIPRLKGVPYLEPGTPIYPSDLEAWEKKTGVKVGAGDALFVRTGVWARRKAEGPWLRGRAEGGKSAGLHPSVIPWLRQRDIALLGSDHPQYVSPSNLRGAVHDFALVYLGIHLIDNCDLEAVADAAAARNRWEFMVTVAPLPVRGATGSPVNPIAVF